MDCLETIRGEDRHANKHRTSDEHCARRMCQKLCENKGGHRVEGYEKVPGAFLRADASCDLTGK